MGIPSSEAVVTRYEAPFVHWVIEDLVDCDVLRAVNVEWPEQWAKEQGKNQFKWNTQKLPPVAREIERAITPELVSEITRIPDLSRDPELFGAGLHCIPHGGFLRTHVDFNQHPKGWHRRVNFLIYLNERWDDEWGGAIELGLTDKVSYMPRGGRAVVFETTDDSWHGHPTPLACPKEIQRRSLALYFYSKTPPVAAAHTTVYRK
jgi:hypothetical protein